MSENPSQHKPTDASPPTDQTQPGVAGSAGILEVPGVPPVSGLWRNRPPRSESARLFMAILGYRSAWFGFAWIGLIAFCGIFAPLIANSFPLLVKLQGRGWSSPLLRHLSMMDVVLPVTTLMLVVVSLLRFSWLTWKRRWFLTIGVLLLTLGVSWWLCRPPLIVIYDTYRVLETQGQVEFALYPPIRFSPSDRQSDRFDMAQPHPRAPSVDNWLGTEINGADIASRMIHACRIAMAVGFISTGIAVMLGILLGGLMGYFSGWVDLLGMRLVEIFDAIPRLYLLLAMLAFWRDERYMLYIIMVVIGLTGWSGYALFLRAEFLKLRKLDFVQAALAAGLPLRSILFKHMLPNGITPVLVSASFSIAGAVNVENMLSFLGIGLVEQPSWGQLISQSTTSGGTFRWWLAVYPGLALSLTIFAYVLIGEAWRDVLDPHTQRTSQL